MRGGDFGLCVAAMDVAVTEVVGEDDDDVRMGAAGGRAHGRSQQEEQLEADGHSEVGGSNHGVRSNWCVAVEALLPRCVGDRKQ